MSQLREFVYLDTISVNSLLASQRVAVPERVKQASEDIDAGSAGLSGGISGSIPGVGGVNIKGNTSSSDESRSLHEVQRKVNDQYKFSILRDVLDDSNNLEKISSIDIEAEGLDISAGDAVEMTGNCDIDPFYRILDTISTLLRIFEAEQLDQPADQEIDIEKQKDELFVENDQNVFDLWKEILHGDYLGLKLTNTEFKYPVVMSISLDSLWIDPSRDFYSNKDYTVVGRVNEVLSSRKKWDFVDLLELMGDVFVEDSVEEFREVLMQVVEDMNTETEDDAFDIDIDIDKSDYVVEGPVIVIDPIAIYW